MFTSLGVRLALATFSVALATCNAPQTPSANPRATATPDVEETVAEAPEPERTFDPDVIQLEPGSALARARASLEAGEAEQAAAHATSGLLDPDSELDAGRLRWMLSRAQRAQGEAVASFETLAPLADDEDHPLARWAQMMRARMALTADAERAAELVEPLAEQDWAGREEARDLRVAALAGAGRADEAEPLLRARIEAAGDDLPRTSALALAELLAAREDDDAAHEEAIELFRAVAMRAPHSGVATSAEERVNELLEALPRARRRALSAVPPELAVIRAERLAAMLRHAEAEEAFEDVVSRTRDEALRCRARYGQGRAIYFRRQRRRSAEHLAAVGRECDDPEIRAWSYYLAGKGFTSAGERDLARAQYARVESEAAQHSLADDARYRAALLDRDDGDEASMVRRLETLAETYPEGDMRGRARFMLAWRARRAGDRAEALRHLEASLSEGPLEDREDLHGRAAYWRASVLAELGRSDEARDGYLDVVRQANVAYYGQHAMARLAALGEAPAAQARAMLGERGDSAIRFQWRDELETASFREALELLRVGELSDARTALAHVRQGSETPEDPELSWIEAALLDRAGEHSLAVALTRRQLPEFMNEPPAGAHFARWRISYPRAYRSVIERAASTLPIPAALVYGIAREESSFRADAVSVAQAYGLTQLILPTAQRFGARIGVRANRRNLTDPDVNVRIGSAYMAWLWERYEPNPFLVPPAYNAGQGATDRWLRERPDQRLDEWIEEIPYDETRRYTRRVIQSWGIYGWLNEGALPELPATLPSSG